MEISNVVSEVLNLRNKQKVAKHFMIHTKNNTTQVLFILTGTFLHQLTTTHPKMVLNIYHLILDLKEQSKILAVNRK